MMRILMVHNEYAKPSGEEHAVGGIASLREAGGHQVRWFLRSAAGNSQDDAGEGRLAGP